MNTYILLDAALFIDEAFCIHVEGDLITARLMALRVNAVNTLTVSRLAALIVQIELQQ